MTHNERVLREALERASAAIHNLPTDSLGFGEDDGGRWSLRDELLGEIGTALASTAGAQSTEAKVEPLSIARRPLTTEEQETAWRGCALATPDSAHQEGE